jgi:hypothetical protein
MDRTCSTNGEKINSYRISVGKPEGKRILGRPRRGRVCNINMDLRELEYDGLDWIDLAQDRDQWKALVTYGNEPSGSIKCGEVLEYLHSSRQLK